MTELFSVIIESSVTMSVVAMLYLVISPFVSKRYAAKSRYYTWLIVAFGFLIPFRFHLPTPIIGVQTAILGEVPLSAVNFATTTPNEQMSSSSAVSWNISVFTIICVLWLIGIILFISYHLNRHRKFLRFIKRWSEDVSDSKTIAILEHVKMRIAITKPVRLQTCTGIFSPMMIGFFKPTILLGMQSISENELSLIFEHELVHFKRRDLWYKVLVLLTTALHWFNPIVHIMAREIGITCELSCDAEVTKYADADRRKQYVESIIGIIRQQTPAQTSLCTNFCSGKQSMKKRVLSIMDGRYKKFGLILPILILLLTLSTGAVFALEHQHSDLPEQNPTVAESIVALAPTLKPEPPAPIISAICTDADNKVSAHKIETNNSYIYESYANSSWTLKQGEITTIVLELNETEPADQVSIGYVLNEKMIELYKGNIENGIQITFTAPQNGDFRFYLGNLSEITVSVEAFSIIPVYALIKDNGYPIIKR